MIYENIHKGIFLERPNRFIAEVLVNGKIEKAHVKNTGRCKEILIKNTKIYLQKSDNPERKTRYSLISAYKNDLLINIDSQVPNQVVYEALQQEKIKEITDIKYLRKEIRYKNSRFDLYYENENEKGFIEVKGVTLENNGVYMFPDAPTERGTKHVNEMIEAVKEGYKGFILFLVQLKGGFYFTPNVETDSLFSETLKKAVDNGVTVLCYDSNVTSNEITLNNPVDFQIR
ncbi:MAG: DNA/RNA nuclease SfsA [Clostridia bacterium]|nr:DNA/RNA nuclease SfsA [Clostridia bacterium]